ncbi:hypothetical protein DFJ74DRAFT_774504 [Hyaloraphidium curvatum]|nr:hypothetical protein DFJ74DRAFT_774504 [Hyaloraphidium curvatum]
MEDTRPAEYAPYPDIDERGGGAPVKPPFAFLSGDELLCLLPAPVAPAAGIGEPAIRDPAAQARNARPLTASAVKDAVGATGDSLLDGLTRISLALAPYSALARFRIGLSNLYTVVVIVPFLWIAGLPHGFGRRQLAATTAVQILEFLSYSFVLTSIRSLFGLIVTLLLITAFRYLASFWTPFVTLGGTMWSSAWAVAGVFFVLARVQNEVPSICGGAGFTDNVAARELERRLTFRAVRRSVEALVGRLRSMVAEEGVEEGDAKGCESWYATLMPLLASRWRQDAMLPQLAALTGVYFGTEAVAIIIFITTGNCVPAYTLALLLTGCGVFASPLLNAAFGNARITQTATLLRQASLSLGRLELCCTEAQQPLARRIAAHSRVLRDLEEVHLDGAGVRLFGARVTGSLARRIAAAALTVMFAAWTVLRAMGVVLTMDMVCPASA